MRSAAEKLAIAHGAFNFSTGLWPVVHRKSFEAVTGPKADFWLVRTVGLLLAATGAVMCMAGARRRVTPEVQLLGAAVPACLTGIDVAYGGSGRISRIYLADAAVQAGLVYAWIRAGGGRPGSRPEFADRVLP